MENNVKKSNTIVIILLIIVIVGMGGFIVFDKINENSNKVNENSNKVNENSNNIETTNDKVKDDNQEESLVIENGYLFSEKNSSAQEQRYKLVVVSGGTRTAENKVDSENDTYYLLDMNNLGSNKAVKKIDLVSIMKNVTEDAKKNKMPSSSKNALGSVTSLSQCNSFNVEYYEPFSNQYLLESYGMDLKKEIPIAVTYFCNTSDYSVAFNRRVYLFNVESNTVKEIDGSSVSDFSNN